jgi:hypothetical protein
MASGNRPVNITSSIEQRTKMDDQAPFSKRIVLEEDAIVSRVVPEDREASEAVLLTGFLGRSRRDGWWRLYRAPDLSEYVEFRQEDVVHTEKTSSDLLPAKGTLVWLKADAVLNRQDARSRSTAADFLSGDIVNTQVIGAAGSLIGPSGGGTEITWTITITVTPALTRTRYTTPQNTKGCCIVQPTAPELCGR